MSNINIRILSEQISYQELLRITGWKISGIYKIENIINHKVYIGQSRNIIKRLKSHLNKEDNIYLRKAFIKYGFDNFSFEVIKQTYDLNYWETFLIQIYHSTDKNYGYNMQRGGEGGDPEITRQSWNNPEIRRKRIESQKGRICSDETKKRMSAAQKGRIVSEETKQKIREKRKLQAPMSEESKLKHKQSVSNYWNSPEGQRQKQINSERSKSSPHAKGKRWFNNGVKNVVDYECPEGFVPGRIGNFSQSEETKQKKSDWYKNLTEEQRKEYKQHLSESHKGFHFNDEQKKHIGDANRGRKYYNNGVIEVMRFEQPDGFVPGRLPSIKEKISKGTKKALSSSK